MCSVSRARVAPSHRHAKLPDANPTKASFQEGKDGHRFQPQPQPGRVLQPLGVLGKHSEEGPGRDLAAVGAS